MIVLLVILAVIALQSANADCPAIEYTIRTDLPYTWGQAFVTCTATGHKLATIMTKAQEVAIEKALASYKDAPGASEGFWIAASIRDLLNYRWWTNGAFLTDTYTKWAEGQPDNAKTDHCTALFYDGSEWQWQNVNCDIQLNYICQTKCC